MFKLLEEHSLRRGRRWSEAEVDQLRELATKISVADLVRIIGRSSGAVTAKAFELRLSLASGNTSRRERCSLPPTQPTSR
jgi:hypothetical protein